MKTRTTKISNPLAKAVAEDRRRFGERAVRPRKGRGSYDRRPKHGED